MYSVLNMRSADRPDDADDLTARARIREAAVRRFAIDGLDASLRAIAADAGVSPGLILHHFGSRAGLREACDEHVHALIRESKNAVLAPDGSSPVALFAALAQLDGYAPYIGYVLRCLQAGGPLAQRFVEQTVEDTLAYLDAAVRAGTVRPSRDPVARARFLAESSLGALLVQQPAIEEHLDLDELPRWLRRYMDQVVLPVLEVYTEGLLTDSTLLDAYVAARDGAHEGAGHGAPAPGRADPPTRTT